jgi:hypothetical protein
MKAKIELYYQGLYDMPVENLDTSNFSIVDPFQTTLFHW